jgi:transposase-like protein
METFHPSPVMMKVSMSPKVTKRKRRLFTPEFKAEAVRLVRGSGKTVAEVARELDLTATCLRAWVNQAAVDEKGDGQGLLTTDERAELTRLRRERRVLEQERDFAKKCAAYFAKSQS